MKTSTESIKQYVREERSLTAFHAVGHAAVYWGFQMAAFDAVYLPTEEGLLEECESGQETGMDGAVFGTLGQLSIRVRSKEYDDTMRKQLGMLQMMIYNGGSFAEYTFGTDSFSNDEFHWLDKMAEDSGFHEDADTKNESDFQAMRRVAATLHPHCCNCFHRAIYKAATWTNEFFSLTSMQAAVRETVTQMLKSDQTYFAREEVYQWMSSGWGNHPLPLQQPKWRRRFSSLLKLGGFIAA